MYEEVIGEPELAALVSGVEGIHTSIRRRLRRIWPEMPPLILSLVGAGLADLVQDPTSWQFPIELQGAPHRSCRSGSACITPAAWATAHEGRSTDIHTSPCSPHRAAHAIRGRS